MIITFYNHTYFNYPAIIFRLFGSCSKTGYKNFNPDRGATRILVLENSNCDLNRFSATYGKA